MVISRTPLRISFAGGGTDLPVYAETAGGAVVSAAIDKYVYVAVQHRFGGGIRVSYTDTEIVDHATELQHAIIREALLRTEVEDVEIVTVAEVPAGTGLGSSAAVTVGVLRALNRYKDVRHWGPFKLAEEALAVERAAISRFVGCQDQCPAAFGGIRAYTFPPGERFTATHDLFSGPLADEISDRLLLLYLGRQRAAGEVLRGIAGEGRDAFETLDGLKRVAQDLTASLCSDTWTLHRIQSIGTALRDGWTLKRELTGVTDPEIDARLGAAIHAGAVGGKISGAGSGGFLLIYVEPEHRANVIEFLGLPELPFRIVLDGSTIIYEDR